ncbi:hypothetical protein [Brevundimonas sp. FT23042]|uniref:hypothetical protein n=1 Tax=Brevundimonas sp. FT23042 TaxID=3393749 RepID=UPI003B5875BC
MNGWIKALNPTAPITTLEEARRSARLSVFGILIGAIIGIVSVTRMMMDHDSIVAAANAATAADPTVAGMGGMIAQAMLYFAIGLIVVQLVLALVQWLTPNIIIPILFTILIIGGLLTPLMTRPAEALSAPVPHILITVGVAAIQLLLHTAGIRGASKLDRLRHAETNA